MLNNFHEFTDLNPSFKFMIREADAIEPSIEVGCATPSWAIGGGRERGRERKPSRGSRARARGALVWKPTQRRRRVAG